MCAGSLRRWRSAAAVGMAFSDTVLSRQRVQQRQQRCAGSLPRVLTVAAGAVASAACVTSVSAGGVAAAAGVEAVSAGGVAAAAGVAVVSVRWRSSRAGCNDSRSWYSGSPAQCSDIILSSVTVKAAISGGGTRPLAPCPTRVNVLAQMCLEIDTAGRDLENAAGVVLQTV